jgi:4'-phosphopantetheinyl transferase
MLNVIVAKCEPGAERETAWDLVRRAFGSAKTEFTEYGKPYFPELPDAHFNISHSLGYAALAISNAPVGVDIERLSRVERIKDRGRFAARAFAKDELENVGGALDFLDIWTRKEAYLKLDGRGLAIGLRSFSVISQSEVKFIQPYFDGEALCTVAFNGKTEMINVNE